MGDRTVRSREKAVAEAVFGPVPSRRLGRSLGINTLSGKTCTYNCVYCQVGATTHCSIRRKAFLDPEELLNCVTHRIKLLTEQGVQIDYISFVSNGEPTLDLRLAEEIRLLRACGHRIAVFTNASLLWRDDVKEDLLLAEYVSVKIDTVREATWRLINRPHRRLRFPAILASISEFTRSFGGVLTTETMLVKDINDTVDEVRAVAHYLASLRRGKSYFAIPVRPPAERFAQVPDPERLAEISDFAGNNVPDAEMLFSSGGAGFEGTGSVEEELLGILSVHPMRQEEAERFVRNKGGGLETLHQMVRKELIRTADFGGKRFYVRCNLGG
jgi:wyosine [tRNA(Phe)-imidazoG37] synthetase (radical SAM superfamily)